MNPVPSRVAVLSAAGGLLLFLSAPGLRAGEAPGPAPETPASVESTRATLAKWVETQQIISKEQQDWRQGKELLESRIALLKDEIGGLQTRIDGLMTGANEADRKKSEFVQQDETLQAASSTLAARVSAMEAHVRRLEVRLPAPAKERVAPLFNRMPADSARTNVSLAERFQNVVGIANEINKLNNEITMTSEVRTLSDGKPSEVRVIWVGLGQAYYVSAAGTEAGVGRPGTEGWEWTNDDSIAPRVAAAVEVLQNKGKPAFLPLPVSIR